MKLKFSFQTSFILFLYFISLFLIQSCGKSQIIETDEKVKIKLMNSLERLLKYEDFNSVELISLSGARNEWISFQLAVRPVETEIKNVSIKLTSFYNEAGNKIDSSKFNLYRENFIEIENSSPETDLDTGWYPDALIPFNHPVSGSDLNGKYDASPYTMKINENTIYFVECQIPADCPAGIYKGSVIVKQKNYPEMIYSIKIRVFDFSLPKYYVMESSFGGASASFKTIYADTIEYAQQHFEQFLLDHRLLPASLYSVIPQIDQKTGDADFTNVHERMSYLFDTLKIKVFPIPLHPNWPFPETIYFNHAKTARYLQSYETYFSDHGWDITPYIYLIDEPELDEFFKIHDVQNLVDAYNLKTKQLVTFHLKPESGSWQELENAVGVWCPSYRLFDDFMNKTLIKEDDLLWTYTALCQVENGKTTPYLQIDFPLLNYRIPFWIMDQLNISGLLYWETNYWNYTDDPWQNSVTYNDGDFDYNGEGNLSYPALDAGFIGLCPSFRLKTLRDGVEDFYILNHAKLLNIKGAQIDLIAKDWNNWNDDSDLLLETMFNLCVLIEENSK